MVKCLIAGGGQFVIAESRLSRPQTVKFVWRAAELDG